MACQSLCLLRSDDGVHKLISDHRKAILAAAARYNVGPRLIASIVYITHRDQLSPFRGALEHLIIAAWAREMRGEPRQPAERKEAALANKN